MIACASLTVGLCRIEAEAQELEHLEFAANEEAAVDLICGHFVLFNEIVYRWTHLSRRAVERLESMPGTTADRHNEIFCPVFE